MTARIAFAAALTAAIGLMLLTGSTRSVVAKDQDEYLPAFKATYPAAAGSRIATCSLCHNISGTEYRRNAYARQWEEEGDESFTAINDLDADGDGYTNLQEIQAHTFPGSASDNPSTVVTTTTVPGTTTTTAAPGSGGAIYAAHCASCHGPSGGDLVPTTLSLSQIVGVTTNGRGSMPGYAGTLTAAEIQLVAEYIFNWSSAPTTTTTQPGTPPAPPPDGAALYGASCAACHGANGGDLVGTPLSRTQLIDVITNGTATGMPAYGASHTAVEIAAMADYLLSFTPPPTTTTTTHPGTPPPPPPSGSAVFAAQCAACHGANGGDLTGRDTSRSRIDSVTRNGTTGMPGFSSRLSAAELDAVVGYVASKSAASATTTTTVPGTPPPSGSTVYAHRCAGCHGRGGGDLLRRGLTASEISSVTTNGTTGMPAFSTRLSTGEITAVAAYVVAVDAGDPAAVVAAETAAESASLYVQFCSACHGAHGEGGRYGPIAGHSIGYVELIAIIRDGAEWMPGFSERMTSAEIGAVARFVESLGVDEPDNASPAANAVPSAGDASAPTTSAPEASVEEAESASAAAQVGIPEEADEAGSDSALMLAALALAIPAGLFTFRRLRGPRNEA